MEKLIKYTTAVLAKECGFDVPCRNYSLENDKRSQNFPSEGCYDPYHGDNRVRNWNKDTVGIKPFYGVVSVPSQDLLRRWLREKFCIHVEIVWVDTLSDIYVYRISTTGNAVRPDSIFYHSYDDALEAGLVEGLSLIETKIKYTKV